MSIFSKEFVFKPMERVRVSSYGLDYLGVIIRCIWEGELTLYDVEYCSNGEIKRREFYASQLILCNRDEI